MSNHQIIAERERERTKEPLLVSRLGIITGVVAICGTIWATGAERGTLAANILELRGAVMTLTSAVAQNTAAINQLKVDQKATATTLEERTSKLEVVTAQNHKAIRQQTQKFNENRADLHRTTLRQEQLAVQQERDRMSAQTAAATSNRNAAAARAVAYRAAEEAKAAKTAAATSADAAADAAMSAATPTPPVIVMAPKAPQRSLKSLLFGTPVTK